MWAALAAILVAVLGVGVWRLMGFGVSTNDRQQVAVPLPPAMGAPALLLPAPDPNLVENSANGQLPIIGKDGRQPWQVYARPFDTTDQLPRVALVISDLGLDRKLSNAAMDRLPGAVTLAFSPYAPKVSDDMHQARSLGHETLLGLPMEPLDYPRVDPGPLTLLASLSQSDNITRLDQMMGKASGYVGFIAVHGGRFTSEKAALVPILGALKQRGLMFVDDKPPTQSSAAPIAAQMNLPWAAADRFIGTNADPASIDRALVDLESLAQRNGTALGVAALSPAIIDHSATWVATLNAKGLVLAPVSAIAGRQPVP